MTSSNALCLVTDAYGGRGGIAQSCRDIIDAFADLDQIERIDIFPRHSPDPPAGIPSKARQHAPIAGRFAYTAAAISSAAGNRPDIVFCNHLFMSPLAALIARAIKAKLIIQLHGIEIWQPPSLAQRRALEAADLVWCVSRDTRARACAFADIVPERAIVVNNTVGREFTPGDRAASRARFGLGDEFALLTVGRLDRREQYKGHDRVICALGNLCANDRNIVYLIAGDGDDRPRLEALTREHNLTERVRFLGSVLAAELPDLYRAADLFVLPSTGEGFGIAFLEAMACGTPAIGLAVGGAADALGDGELGMCVSEAEFPDALERAICAPRPDPSRLSSAVNLRLGYTSFRHRIMQAMRLLFGSAAGSTSASRAADFDSVSGFQST